MPAAGEIARAIDACLEREGAATSSVQVAWQPDASTRAGAARMSFAEFDQVLIEIRRKLPEARDRWLKRPSLKFVYSS